LGKSISETLGHDVKLCDQNLQLSWYSTWMCTSFASICVARDAPKIMQVVSSCQSKFDYNV
jgi:hypothetical protein